MGGQTLKSRTSPVFSFYGVSLCMPTLATPCSRGQPRFFRVSQLEICLCLWLLFSVDDCTLLAILSRMGNTQARVEFEDGNVVLFKDGETLADITQVHGPGFLRNVEDGSVSYAQHKKIASGKYKFVKKKIAVVGYEVRATVFGALSCTGARGNVYKYLERHLGGYSQSEGHEECVKYDSNDLKVKACFKSYDNARYFQNALNGWAMHLELVNLTGVDVTPVEPAEIVLPTDFRPFTLMDYDASASESPCGDLDMLRSYRISVPITEAVDENSPLVMYQSLDRRQLGLKHYKCHLHDKAKNKANESNMAAASWTFHQMLDGLNTAEKIPLLRLSFRGASRQRLSDKDQRYQVKVGIHFKDEALALNYQNPEGARKMDEKSWEVTVYVKDKAVFEKCVKWKDADTQAKWNSYDEELNSD